mmetsp:Transcript_82900/g.162534  ORF Transcript_82900/g.162534 Transcript_82900/m.162534 type:complete len:204 (-) Transcript_82900:191-802(-)
MATINESSFTVVAPPNKNKKPVFILDEDDYDDNDDHVHYIQEEPSTITIMESTTTPRSCCFQRVVHDPSASSSCLSLLGTGMQSFQDCIHLQREILTMQESLFQGMTQKVVNTQEQVVQLEQEIRRLGTELERTRTLLLQEKEQNQTLKGYLHHYPSLPLHQDHKENNDHDDEDEHHRILLSTKDHPCSQHPCLPVQTKVRWW